MSLIPALATDLPRTKAFCFSAPVNGIDDLCLIDDMLGAEHNGWQVLTTNGLPKGLSGKESACQCRTLGRHGFDP